MKRNLELTLEMQLGKLNNLYNACSNLEKKILNLQEEIRRYESAASDCWKNISDLGLSRIPENHQNDETTEARRAREERNEFMQKEKAEFISNNYPELVNFSVPEETGMAKLLGLAGLSNPESGS